MAPIATALCILFIVWLLKRDARRRPRLSAATWVPTLVLFTMGSRPPSQWLGVGSANNMLDQAYFGGLILVLFVILFLRPVPWARVAAANPALLLFYGYFALSALWSYHTGDSIIRVVKDFGLTVPAALLLLSEKRPSEAIRAVYVRCACVAFPLSLVYTRYYTLGKAFSRNGSLMYTGVSTNKNLLGDMLAVYIFFVAWDYLESRAGRADRLWNRGWRGHLALLLIGFWMATPLPEHDLDGQRRGWACVVGLPQLVEDLADGAPGALRNCSLAPGASGIYPKLPLDLVAPSERYGAGYDPHRPDRHLERHKGVEYKPPDRRRVLEFLEYRDRHDNSRRGIADRGRDHTERA